jgi:hypothetical protein
MRALIYDVEESDPHRFTKDGEIPRMKLSIQWSKPLTLKDASLENLIYRAEIEKLPNAPGIYVFGRRWGGNQFEALYVGKANKIRGRVNGHFNNLRLMQHLKGAKNGKDLFDIFCPKGTIW